jgi:sugar-specific transcriptional regulator TrmB
MKIEESLRIIGLTESEIKVYLALLKIGTSSKGPIIKESRIASSKIYDVLDKLMKKGLASTIIKNNVNHYSAAPPSRINDYLNTRQEELKEHENIITSILPKLNALHGRVNADTKAEIFVGWKGMHTVYSTLMLNSKKGDFAYILGASKGTDPVKTESFFHIYSARTKQKGINVKVIFNETSRSYVTSLEKKSGIKFDKRFLFKNTPVEFLIGKSACAIVMLKAEPIIVLIHDKETADSLILYFQELWKIAKK